MYESEIEDLKYEIKELKKLLNHAQSDAQYESIEDAIFEKEYRIKEIEEEIEDLKNQGQWYSDNDLGIAEYGMKED